MGLDLDKIIETSERLDNIAVSQQRAPRRQQVSSINIDELDEITNRTSPMIVANQQNNERHYDANNEIEKLNEARNNGLSFQNARNCGLPADVLDSIIKNPCMLDPTIAQRTTPNKDLVGDSGNNAFDKMKSLMARQNEKDLREAEVAAGRFKQQSNNASNESIPQTSSIDYGIIKAIVESVVKEELKGFKEQMLNENLSRANNGTGLSFLRVDSKGIRLVDANNRVYECEIKYLGTRNTPQK